MTPDSDGDTPVRADDPAVPWGAAVLMVLLAFALFTLGSSSRGLWNPDEPREAAICREMYSGADPVCPRLNGQPFLEKPPLYAWLASLVFAARGGPDVWGARLPSALTGALCVGLTVVAAGLIVGRRRAWLAGLAMATMPLFWWHSSRANLDVPLALFVSCACAGFWAWARRADDPDAPSRWPAIVWVAAASLGLAFLTKGLVGLVLPSLIIVTAVALTGRPALLWRVNPLKVAVVVAAIVLPWFIPFCLRDDGRLAYGFVVVHHLQRYASGFDHLRPWHYYLWILPLITFPWSAGLIPAALRTRRALSFDLVFLWCWALVPALFFSLSACKRDLYLLPSFPAIAILAVWGLAEGLHPRGQRGAFVLAGTLLAVVGAFVGFYPARPGPSSLSTWIASERPLLALFGALLAVTGLVCLTAGALGRRRPGVASLAFAAVFVAVTALGRIGPSFDVVKSGRGVVAALVASPRVAGFRLQEGDLGVFVFPYGRPFPVVTSRADLTRMLGSGHRVVASAGVLGPELAACGIATTEVARAPVGSDTFVLVEKRAVR